MTTLVLTILIVFLIYAFVGVLSFIPFFVGLLISVITFPVEFLNSIYPVWVFPSIVLSVYWLIFLGYFIIHLIKH